MNDEINLEKLTVYQEAKSLRRKVFDLANTFPKDEKFLFRDQIIRSTRKCPANIAEGYDQLYQDYQNEVTKIIRILNGYIIPRKEKIHLTTNHYTT